MSVKQPTEQDKAQVRKALQTMTSDEWESMMRMFLPQLLDSQGFLFDLIADRTRYNAERFQTDDPIELMRQVLGNVGLKFTSGV